MSGPVTERQRELAVVDSTGNRVAPGQILFTAEQIRHRIAELANEIVSSYEGQSELQLMIVAIMTGATMFLADLVRAIPLPIRIGLMIVTNYPGAATQAQGPRLIYDLQADITGKDVLIVDDILDTGRTLEKVIDVLRSRRPRSLKTCVLLEKNISGPRAVQADFVGFQIPDKFVVGYGLDYDNLFRNFPSIAVLDTQG
jgi:hypoxanthine phosphoribosyltransferase